MNRLLAVWFTLICLAAPARAQEFDFDEIKRVLEESGVHVEDVSVAPIITPLAFDTASDRQNKFELLVRPMSRSDYELAAKLRDGGEHDVIHAFLLLREPCYATTVALIDSALMTTPTLDEEKAIAVQLERLLDFNSQLRDPNNRLYFKACISFQLGRFLVDRGDYASAAAVLAPILLEPNRAYSMRLEETAYLLGVAYAHLIDPDADDKHTVIEFRQKATWCLTAVANAPMSYPCPERYRASAAWILSEVGGAGGGALIDLCNRMHAVETMIAGTSTGLDVQRRQEKLIGDLDKLIKKYETKESSSRSAMGGGGFAGPPRIADTNKSQIWKSNRGLDLDSDAMRLLETKFPERYKALVEQYYKALAETPLSEKKR